MASCFKVPFNLADHKDILPDVDEYRKHDFILNEDQFNKGNIDNCIWQKYKPSFLETKSPEFREREARRILKTGVWIAIKEEPLWIPPQYYFALQYGKTGGDNLQFRLKRLLHVYFKIRTRNNPHYKATFTVKNRQDGETTMAISDSFWETFEMTDGQVGIISKTRADAINPCWKTMQTLWMNLPYWFKEDLCSDFASGKNIAESMKFMRDADDERGIEARNILLTYYPAVYNAMDGKNNVKKVIVDEFLKWIECNFGDFFNNASKFIMPGFERRGMFDMFSSPPEKMSQSYKDGYELWLKSDPNKLDEHGVTESRVARWYSNPLHGIQGAYDNFGDADPERIYDWIMKERGRQPNSKKLEEVRGFPLNDEEIWGSMDGGYFWDNHKGLQERQIYLLGTRVKNEKTKEPKAIFGNFEWKSGIVDNPEGVDFRTADKEEFDVISARWGISHIPRNLPELKNIFQRPSYVETVIGADPFGKRHPGKSPSNGAAVAYKFLDLLETGINKTPTGLYLNRPYHEDIYFEDVLKACIFFQAPLQFENNHDRIGGYFTDRGYKDWVLPSIGEPRGSDKLGDSITARGKFIDEMIMLLNSHINIPVNPEDPCLLNRIWFKEIIDDMLAFNLKDTHLNDATMAFGQALAGAAKLLLKKKNRPNAFNDSVLKYLLD
jgi:hypothetical protein